MIELRNRPLPPGFHPLKLLSLNPGLVRILPVGTAGTQAVVVDVTRVVVVWLFVDVTVSESTTLEMIVVVTIWISWIFQSWYVQVETHTKLFLCL